MARSCFVQGKIPLSYWEEDLDHASKARKIMIHSATKTSPYVDLFGIAPEYAKKMRPFGCSDLVTPLYRKKPKKFDSRLIEGVKLCLE